MFAVRTASLLVGALLLGCSGASAPEIPSIVTETSSSEPGEATESIPSHAPAAPSKDAPEAAGDPPEPAPPEPPPCAVETEPNDSVARATTFTTCISGELASSKDRDYLRVVAPAGARKMVVEHEEADGKVSYRVGREDEGAVDFDHTFTGAAPPIVVTPGATYAFRLTFAAGGTKAARPYELAVTFE